MDKEETLTSKLLAFLEKDRFSLTSALVYVSIIAGIRSLMEARVGSYHGYGIYLFSQHVLLSYPELLIGVLIIYLMVRKHPKSIMNFFLLGWGLLLVPPIADYFLFGGIGIELGTQYEYLEINEIVPTLLNGWNPFYIYNLGSRGQGLMFLGLMFGSASYTALKTRLNQKVLRFFRDGVFDKKLIQNVLQTVGSYLGIFILVWFIGCFKAIIRLEADHYVVFNHFKIPLYSRYYLFFKQHNYPENLIFPPADSGIVGLPANLITNQSRLIFCSYFILLTIITTLIMLYLTQRKRLAATLKNIPKMKIALFSLSAFIGISSVRMIDPDFSKGFALDPTYLLHMPYIFLSILIIVLLGLFSYFVKRIYLHNSEDENLFAKYIDDDLNKYHYKHLSASTAITALYFSIILGYISFVISIFWIITCILLTTKEKNIFRKNIKTTMWGVLSFFLGFFTPNAWRSYIVYLTGEVEVTYEVVSRRPPFNLNHFMIVIWILVALWFITKITSLDDIKMNLFSQLSDTKNQQIVLIAMAILLLFPLIFFTSFAGLVIFIGPAIATPVWYKIFERTDVISFGFALQFLLFIIGLLYIY